MLHCRLAAALLLAVIALAAGPVAAQPEPAPSELYYEPEEALLGPPLGEPLYGPEAAELMPGHPPASHPGHLQSHSRRPWFRSSANSPRHLGRGEPMSGTSWLNRPLSASLFVGPMFNQPLVSGSVDQKNSVLAGFRLGWDYDHYWGSELRFGWSGTQLEGPVDADHGAVFLGDLNFLYYPWGDSRWRPYALLGVGVANYDYTDHLQMKHDAVLLGMPFGGGIKYHVHPRMAFRLELLDNFAIGSDGTDSMHNVSLTFNLEFRFGGTRKGYFPWQPSRHLW